MANDYFQFKQFNIQQSKCAMKTGTDGVLLGAWVSVESCHTLLDVGTGTGVIALMLAQRSRAVIDAIDIDGDAAGQAAENISSSAFAGRIQVYHTSFEEYAGKTSGRYDLIVSNPPYFAESLKSPDMKKNLARHSDTLPLSSLLSGSKSLLAPDGRIALVFPCLREKELIETILENKLNMVRKTEVIPVPKASPKRLLIELSANLSAPCVCDILVIEESRGQYTADYIKLTKDFYLKM
ncbi:MAG: methyltransferase [Tannerellaceae bacterium]|jgi:tRNA1Val (adenine37-N6)-methyltransferase|nr:methyltransferase [Tannerellaceae bacterium]